MEDVREEIARAIEAKAGEIDRGFDRLPRDILGHSEVLRATVRGVLEMFVAFVRAMPDPGWIPVAERVPEDGVHILGVLSRSQYDDDWPAPPMVVAWRNGASHGSYEGTWDTLDSDAPLPRDYISHWRPLPAFAEAPPDA